MFCSPLHPMYPHLQRCKVRYAGVSTGIVSSSTTNKPATVLHRCVCVCITMCLLWVWTSAHACAMSMLITLCMEDSPDCFCLHRCLTYLPWSGFIEAGLLTGLELLTSFHSLLDGNSCCPSPFTAQWLRKDSKKHLLQKWICRNSYLHSKIKLKLESSQNPSILVLHVSDLECLQ